MKPKALLLLSLFLALAVYIVAFYTPGHAQQGPSTVRVHDVSDALPYRGTSNGIQVPGRIIGFSCVVREQKGYPDCYVATTD